MNSASKNPSVVVYESLPFGHRLHFVRLLSEALGEIGIRPTLATNRKVLESEEFQMYFAETSVPFDVLELHSVPTSTRSVVHQILSLPSRINVSRLYIPSGDGVAQILGLRSRLSTFTRRLLSRTEVLVLGGKFGYQNPPYRQLRNRIACWSFNTCVWKSFFHLDALQAKWLARSNCGVRAMPDPVQRVPSVSQIDARKSLAIPIDGRYAGCAGWIEKSKGSHNLLDVFANACKLLPTNCRLLLAGPVKDGIHQYAQKEYGQLIRNRQIIIIDKLLTEIELTSAIQSLDVVCLPYQRSFQSSGIFLRAVAAMRAVAVHESGWLGEMVRKLDNGFCVNVNSPADFSALLIEVLGGGRDIAVNPSRIEQFLDFHSEWNFKSTWTSSISHDLDFADNLKVRNWDQIWN